MNTKNCKAWVVTVNMGYGHRRATYPLRDIACQEIKVADIYKGIPDNERKLWSRTQRTYEYISRLDKIPLLGDIIFGVFDKIQQILPFYPRRDLSKPNLQLRQTYNFVEKLGMGKDLIGRLKKMNPKLPLIASFYLEVFAAEIYGYPGKIYCIICDADIARTWAPRDRSSRINYLAPTSQVVERLRMYGVNPKQIIFTGFPLPKENLGGRDMSILRADLGYRLFNLDPNQVFIKKHEPTIRKELGDMNFPHRSNHCLTLAFVIGGAGAQTDLALTLTKSLKKRIEKQQIKLNLIAGSRPEVKRKFEEGLKIMGMRNQLGKGVRVIFAADKMEYFKIFNQSLHTTDILWTKPSEMVFYTALGLPVVMAPSLGSQEVSNREWLEHLGSGIRQKDPAYAIEWIFDWINNGWLAEAAFQGFMDAPKEGVYNIEDILLRKSH